MSLATSVKKLTAESTFTFRVRRILMATPPRRRAAPR